MTMEKSSRVNKYRELRESLKEEATLPKQDIQEYNDEYDDSKIPTLREYRMKQYVEEVKGFEEEGNELDGVKSELESKEIEKAISRVRMTSGKGEQYNTRLDILNHIQSGAMKKVDQTPIVVPDVEDVKEEILEEPIQEEIVEEVVGKEPVKHFKIFFEDDEDDEEIQEKVEEVKEEKSHSIFKRHKMFEEDEMDDEEEIQFNNDEDDDEDEEGSSVMMKVLTGLIVLLSICLVGLIGYIIKLFLF